jgi:hypothetical protein
VIRLLEYGFAFAGLALLAWLPGFALVRGLAPLRALGPLSRLAELSLGPAFWMVWVFALASLQALRPSGLAAAAIGWTAVAVGVLRRRSGGGAQSASGTRPPVPGQRLFAAFLAALLVPFFLRALAPEVAWDASVYHLTVPRLYLEHGGFRAIAFNVYSNWPLATEMLFAAAMLVRDHVLATLVHFGFGLLVCLALLLAGREERQAAAGWLAVALFLANDVVAQELGVAYVDLAHAFFLLAAVLFLHRARRGGDGAGSALLLSGICCGVVAGIKVTGIASAAAIGALYLPELVRAARSGLLSRRLGGFALRFAAPVLALWLPWLAKAAWFTGDPLYPLLHAWLGGPEWSPALAERFAAWQRSIGMGREPLDHLLLPARVILFGGPGYDRFHGSIGSFWIALLPLTLLAGLRRPLVRGALLVSGLHFVFWALTSQQTRLLIPVLPLLALSGALTVADLLERLEAPRRQTAWRATFAGCALWLVVALGAHVEAGVGQLARFHRDRDPAPDVPAVYAVINERLPRDARILFLNHNRGFFCQREYVADSFFEASQIADWLAAAQDEADLRRLLDTAGITHVLVEHQPWGIEYPDALVRLLADPERVQLVHRSDDGRFELVALRS